jgi:formylglycine-generating enzyme required for sulfatase activity
MLICEGQSFVASKLPSGGTSLYFLWVEAGSFLMGSPKSEVGRGESEGRFLAKLSQGFWLSRNLVTQGQWRSVMKYNSSHFQENGEDRPAENVSWFEAMEFCQRLTKMPSAPLPAEYEFSLPTEAQWEYACRAGTTTKYFCGEVDAELDRFTWHSGNSQGETHAVGLKEANPWGFYDMYGNVFEWCYDDLAEYPSGEAIDWIGSKESGLRILRGSGYGSIVSQGSFRSAHRSYWEPEVKRPWCGFRVALRSGKV